MKEACGSSRGLVFLKGKSKKLVSTNSSFDYQRDELSESQQNRIFSIHSNRIRMTARVQVETLAQKTTGFRACRGIVVQNSFSLALTNFVRSYQRISTPAL
jgi:hypothetical protein